MPGPIRAQNTTQLYQYGLEGGQCALSLPDAALERYIDYYWLLTINDVQIELDVIPDMATDLVLCPTLPDFAALYPPVDSKISIPLHGPICYAGICFRTGQFNRLFNRALNDLRGTAPGNDTINALQLRALVDGVQGLVSIEVLSAFFDNYWHQRVQTLASPALETPRLDQAQILDAIRLSLGAQGIESVCSTLGVSDRQFRRLSMQQLGVTPKKIQSILRLQAALTDLLATDLPEVEDLYYDESHRIRELKKLTGLTPAQIRDMAEKYNRG